jgi:NitT/TauT family transport system substrate-binding protein
MERGIKASLLLLALTVAHEASAQDRLKIAVGGRGIGETFVTEVGDNAGLFRKHNLALDIFYTDGGGETQQAVISNSAQIGVASGFLGAIGVFAKGAPVRIIGGSYTGGSQVFWYVPASSSIKRVQISKARPLPIRQAVPRRMRARWRCRSTTRSTSS